MFWLVLGVVVVGCGSSGSTSPTTVTAPNADATSITAGAGEQRFPDVVAATAQRQPDGTWMFSATLSSPYDTPDRYADAWRVLGPDGTALAIRELTHDHQNEQPFTRTLDGVVVPDGVSSVVVEGRDLQYGWGGATVSVALRAEG